MRTIISAGGIVQRALEVTHRENDSTMSSRLYRELDRIYKRLCASHPFEALRRTKAYASDDSMIVPANASGVRWVVDENGEVYRYIDNGATDNGAKHFTLNTISDIPDASGLPFVSEDLSITSGASTFTSEALALAIADSKVPDSISVSGTGVVNGSYPPVGTLDDHPYFELEDSGTTGRIRYSNDLAGWIYAESSTGYTEKYGVISESDLPDKTGWVTIPAGAATDIALSYTEDDGITAVGEIAIFGGEDELFEITAESGSTFTLDRPYNGSSLSAGVLFVRPPQTQEIVLYDQNGEVEDSVDFTLYYWIVPPSLRKASDLVLLPDAEALELLLLRSMPEAKKDRPVSKNEMDQAVSNLKHMNPDNAPKFPTKNRYNVVSKATVTTVYGGTRR